VLRRERRSSNVLGSTLLFGQLVSFLGASDHGTHEAIYLHDPDHNGIELAWEREPSEWPRMGDRVNFMRRPLDFGSLLAELEQPVPE
jgi:catechol-2,3-dioxygenase